MILNHTAPNVEPSILDGCEVPLRDFVFVYTYNAYNCIPAKNLLLILKSCKPFSKKDNSY